MGLLPVLQHCFLLIPAGQHGISPWHAQEGFSCCHGSVFLLSGGFGGTPKVVLVHPWGFTCEMEPSAQYSWGPEQQLLSLFRLLQGSCPHVFGV